jgi:Carboxypeptidase regulatory-like domain
MAWINNRRQLGRLVGGLGIVLAAVLLSVLPVCAQDFAAVTGVVTDKGGGPVGAADVSLDNDKVGLHVKTQTNEQGVYQFLRVAPGDGYNLSFSKTGFKKFSLNNVYLGVGITSTLNAVLEVGAVTETIEVKASSETLNTTDASVGNVLDSEMLHSLPILIRESPATLLGLEAGVVANSGGGANRNGAVTGSRTDQGNVTIDGIDVNDQAGGFAFATVANAPIDSIQEFRTVTADQDATGGRSGGAQVIVTTTSGTNSFHGSLYEYNRTAATAANDFFNNEAGVPTPALTRNQFGGAIGGPVKKDKLFFFFNYEGRRDASGSAQLRIVPLAAERSGGLAYVNNGTDASGKACTSSARLNNPVTAPCITILSSAQVAALDPQGVGADAALLAVSNSRYPKANDLTAGDGINTGGFRFNAPDRIDHNTYVTRIDYKLSSKQSLFGRFNIVRENDTQVVSQFPGDPPAQTFQDRSYSYVIGHNWTINSKNINSLTFGVTNQYNNFPASPGAFPTFPNEFTDGPFSGAFFSNFNIQGRTVPVPTIRDDYTMIKGKHTMTFGVDVRPIHNKSSLENNFNFLGIGIGGNLSSLGPDGSTLRPNNILTGSPTERAEYDANFAFLLGRFASQSTNFNYNQSLQPEPAGTPANRDFHYNEFESYWQDSWHARNDMTITYGVRWSYYSVPFEANGFETVPNIGPAALFSARVLAGEQGNSSNNAVPFLSYGLGGKANGTPGYFQPTLDNFGPRLGIAWSPSFTNGFLHTMFGDRKTSVRLGGARVFDRVASTVTFIADQVGFLFDNNAATLFGNSADPSGSLKNDPRFTSLSAPPIAITPPIQTNPTTPFVDATGAPFGEAAGQFIYAVDPNFKTPYEDVYTFGIQRELPRNFSMEVAYVGRFGRRLFTQADAAQVVDFKDPASGQGLIAAFNALAVQARAGVKPANIKPEPFFENQVFPGASGALVGSGFDQFLLFGDLSDFVQGLNSIGLLASNIGLDGQSPTIAYVSSKGSSNYNGLLTTLRKRFSDGLQMDFNYTYSHSIDNQSSVVNTVVGGLICDISNLRVCRGNSDFDAKHVISVDWFYDLPFGRDRFIGRNMPGWANAIVGGWRTSGIWTWRTGFAFGTIADAFPVGFNFDSPGVLTGSKSALSSNIHNENGALQFFSNPTAALGAFSEPFGDQIGNRNNLRGPHFWDTDVSVLKDIKLPWSEKQKFVFRVDAFNVFNHESFVEPGTDLNSSTFGQLTTSRSTPRQLQVALRFEF